MHPLHGAGDIHLLAEQTLIAMGAKTMSWHRPWHMPWHRTWHAMAYTTASRGLPWHIDGDASV